MNFVRRLGYWINRTGFPLWGFPLVLLAVFFFLPMASIMRLMFTQPGQIDLGGIWQPLGFTIWQAVLSTLLTLLVGLPAAFIYSRYIFPGKKLMKTLTLLPFILPTVVVAAGFNALIGPGGGSISS